MKHFRWTLASLAVGALAACESAPVEPDAGADSDAPLAVSTAVLGMVPVGDGSGHLYDAVSVDGGIDWNEARSQAEDLTTGTCQAGLASVTSLEENTFIVSNLTVLDLVGDGLWIGGYEATGEAAPSEGWAWVSGEPYGYTNWSAGRPDGFGTLDAMHYVAAEGAGGFGTPTARWEDSEPATTRPGYVVEFSGECLEADVVDILLKLKQGEGVRGINLKSQGKIAAVVLSSDGEFDASTIDPETVTLGDGSDPDAPVASNPHGKLMVAWPDLNEDGLTDALFHFNTQDLVDAGLTLGTTELVLRGMAGGEEFSGVDAVEVK